MEHTKPESHSDDELVRVFQADPTGPAGRRAAETLLTRWQYRIYLWCFRMLRDREQAMDVAQESLVRAYRALPRFEPRARVSSWMFAITHNRCLSALRARPLRRDPDVDPDELLDALAGPEEAAEQRDRLDRVLRAMDESLDPLERRALWLRAYEGMRVDEITKKLGLEGPSGARGLLQTARRKLRAALGENGRDDEGEA